jgi:hypothetical protein
MNGQTDGVEDAAMTITVKNVSWSTLGVLLGPKIAREWREEIGLCDYLISFSGEAADEDN